MNSRGPSPAAVKRRQTHRAMRTGARIVADHPGAAADARLVQPPTDDDLRRVFERMRPPEMPDPLGRTAHHEAAHVAVAEHFGIKPIFATITRSADGVSGLMDFKRADPDAPPTKPDPQAALCAASIHHAGLAAEMLFSGIEPGRTLYVRASSNDYINAVSILHPHYGHSTGAHWYAQRTALNILSANWERVQEIAAHLLEHGEWTPTQTAT